MTGRLTIVVVVALAALAALAAAAAHGDDVDAAEAAEWAEFGPFFRRFERLERATRTGAAFEPDTPWLKTCAGWSAQEMCATVFGSGLSEELAYAEDLGYIPRAAVSFEVDYVDKSVTAMCLFSNPLNQTYKSIWRQGLGCTLVERLSEAEIRAIDTGDQAPRPLDPAVPWPLGDGFFPERVPDGVDLDCIQGVTDPDFADRIANPRATVVIYKGELVYERYAPGITKDNPLIGWSATKSLTQALLSTVVKDGLIDIYRPADVPEWYVDRDDPRQNITYDMMLRMSSGTRWTGDVPPTTGCIFWSDADCAHKCALQPLVEEPDTVWNYNSGSSYIMSRELLENRRDLQWNNYEWPKNKLFRRISADTMYIEYQPNGFFLGGAYGYGTPRDWARFGLLYLRDGVWVDGERLLPEGWVRYTSTPTPDNNSYGAHFWRNPSVDDRLFYASGFRNQNVYVFPRQDLVIARFAMPPLAAVNAFDSTTYLRNMLACFPGAPKAVPGV